MMAAPKLSDDAVLAIRRRYRAGEYASALAAEFLIDDSYAQRIIRGVRRGTLEAVVGPRKPRRVFSWAGAVKPDVESDLAPAWSRQRSRERQAKHRNGAKG